MENKNITVVVGLSGGVDSSVAAFILKEQGYNVIGVTMKVCDPVKYPEAKKSACFGAGEEEDIEKAQQTADLLGIPYHVIDLSSQYESIVIDYFTAEYLGGKTPNPCIRCNALVKFGLLPEMTRKSGIPFDFFATGHYVRVAFDEKTKRYLLKKAVFTKKDQSYFLSLLTQDKLSNVIFPLGELTKEEVRDIARKAGLPSAEREESQDFYGGEISDLFKGKDASAGSIKTLDGKEIGKHTGIYNYTIGKRRGIGQTTGEKLYVVGIDSKTNTIIAGDEEQLYGDSLTVSNIHWIAIPDLTEQRECKVRIRYRHDEADAVITPLENNQVGVVFKERQKSITPGQYAVFYDGDVVLGGGVIE